MGLVLVPHEQRESCQLLVRVCARLGQILMIEIMPEAMLLPLGLCQ